MTQTQTQAPLAPAPRRYVPPHLRNQLTSSGSSTGTSTASTSTATNQGGRSPLATESSTLPTSPSTSRYSSPSLASGSQRLNRDAEQYPPAKYPGSSSASPSSSTHRDYSAVPGSYSSQSHSQTQPYSSNGRYEPPSQRWRSTPPPPSSHPQQHLAQQSWQQAGQDTDRNQAGPSRALGRGTYSHLYRNGPGAGDPYFLSGTGSAIASASASATATASPSAAHSAPLPTARRPPGGSPSLYIFGDSFVGPFKLLSEDSVGIKTFKGASAKGLNNPNSLKQVSNDLLPTLHDLLAPPPYKYIPSSGRWVMLVFGNVDLQINYLWQLQHKAISAVSFSETECERHTTRPSAESLLSPAVDDDDDNDDSQEPPLGVHGDEVPPAEGGNILANATETSLKGPALGPELFVHAVVKAYTAWLEREIVNGPIGDRIRAYICISPSQSTSSTTAPPAPRRPSHRANKVLIAAALPPLVEDQTLHRIPEKYVERLEEEHEKKAKAMTRGPSDIGAGVGAGAGMGTGSGSGGGAGAGSLEELAGHSKTPWARSGTATPVEVGLSTLGLSDDPSARTRSPRTSTQALAHQSHPSALAKSSSTPHSKQLHQGSSAETPASPKSSSSRSESSHTSSSLGEFSSSGMSQSTLTTASSTVDTDSDRQPSSEGADPDTTKQYGAGNNHQPKINTSIETLLAYPTPLCTLPTRVRMTNLYNQLLSEFCDRHSDFFSFVDISPHMHAGREAGHQGEIGNGTEARDVNTRGSIRVVNKSDVDQDVTQPSSLSLPPNRNEAQSSDKLSDRTRTCHESESSVEAQSSNEQTPYTSLYGEVDRSTWACPVDPTNIHPVWEATLPLWLTELKDAGVPVDRFELDEDAEETFKAYEVDKRRRTEGRDQAWSKSTGEGEGEGEGEGGHPGLVHGSNDKEGNTEGHSKAEEDGAWRRNYVAREE